MEKLPTRDTPTSTSYWPDLNVSRELWTRCLWLVYFVWFWILVNFMCVLDYWWCHPIWHYQERAIRNRFFISLHNWKSTTILNWYMNSVIQWLMNVSLINRIGHHRNLATSRERRLSLIICQNHVVWALLCVPRWMIIMPQTWWLGNHKPDNLFSSIMLRCIGGVRNRLLLNVHLLVQISLQWNNAVNTSKVCNTNFKWWASLWVIWHMYMEKINLF
jgi:hypothetical protein